jgi:tRNA modification GTPase
MKFNDTIAAISTALAEAGISMLRISGDEAFEISEKIFFKDKSGLKKINLKDTPSHTIHFGYLFSGGELLDEVLLSVFKSPDSYTGENVIELTTHGGVMLTQMALKAILNAGAKHAEPGEFTKRAFLNGRIDLSQAEAVADLIHSKTDSAHKSSIEQLEGSLSGFVSNVRADLLNVISLVELELDFAEEDVTFVNQDELLEKINNIILQIKKILSTYIAGRVIRDGIKLVIAGKPNSGKSSLFNKLLNSERAIVSVTPGTTRDYLEENIIINGILFNLIDTAGIRLSEDEIESEGIRRSYEKIKSSDLALFLIDSSIGDEQQKESLKYYEKYFAKEKTILCLTKSDLGDSSSLINKIHDAVKISIYDDSSIEVLKNQMTGRFLKSKNEISPGRIILTNMRHKLCLEKVISSLEASRYSIESNMSGEFISLDLRAAIISLGEITGEFTNEEVLNHIFSRFCIGK